MRRIAITGAPGTGKTSLVTHLAATYATVPEPARRVLAKHGGSLDHDPDRFVELLIEMAIEDFNSVTGEIVVFDRGVPDCVAYATVSGVDPAAALEASSGHRYEKRVFLAPPWREIYSTDDLRRATYAQIEEFHQHVVAVYEELDYELTELPQGSVADRAAFVARHLGVPTGRGPNPPPRRHS